MAGAAALIADLIALGGAGIDVTPADQSPGDTSAVVRVGVHREGPRPDGPHLEAFDILLSLEPDAPRPWVGVQDVDSVLASLKAVVAAQPVAASVCAQVLRLSPGLSFDGALAVESMAFSMLLASDGFKAWRADRPVKARADPGGQRVGIDVSESGIALRLMRPDVRNAFDAAMRDALSEALLFALEHPDQPAVTLSGEGPCFSAGGDLDEFGAATDVGLAHLIRTLRSPVRLARGLGDRLTVELHGACVGAGIEVPAAAGRVVARAGSVFRLPEVSMGLIPGAGGTASLPRRIGRQRAAWLAISGATLDAERARVWGLLDAVIP
jgi:hypothetical protein